MTDWRRGALVEARADLILSDQSSAEAYAFHFEAQMRYGTIRRLLNIGLRVLRWVAQASGPG
jgi:hypothetical protein